MTDNIVWQKLEPMRPSLPRHIHIQRRDYNNERWFILQDKSNGRFHRLTPTAWRLIAAMDGRRSLQPVLDLAAQPEFYESPDDIPTRDDLIQLLQYLHVADLLVCDMPPDTQELFARRQHKQQQRWVRLLMNPLTWHIPLGNPDALLDRLMPLARLMASRVMGIVWLLVVGYSLMQAGNHWSQLTHGQLDRILSPGNLLMLWLTYPCLKIIHELGHGLFTKVWGGHVHECGVVFVLGTPLPYVVASAATGFRSKAQRLMVSAAGMAVEIFLAAIALLLWLQVLPGLFRDFLYNIILIGSVSTLFFNGNPLMRFDGYHLLTDALDLPNLASRANQQVSYLVRRYGFGMAGLLSPAGNSREAFIFVIYAFAAFAYRLSMLFFIIVLAASYFPTLGLVLACWLIFFQLCWPVLGYAHYLLHNQQLQTSRKRALAVTSVSLVVVLVSFVSIPLPMSTSAEAVIWLPEEARLKTESSGAVVEVLVVDGEQVSEGQLLLRLDNPVVRAELAVQQASLREFEARYQQAWVDDRAQAQMLQQDIEAIKASIQHLQNQVDHLEVRSPASGTLRFTRVDALLGSYFQRGDKFGLIETDNPIRARAALTQEEVGLVRQSLARVEIRLVSNLAKTLPATIIQEVPAATRELPSQVLGAQGGGRLAVDAAIGGTRAAEDVFLVDLGVADSTWSGRYGERVYVRFVHPAESGAIQLYRALQQLFIRSFS